MYLVFRSRAERRWISCLLCGGNDRVSAGRGRCPGGRGAAGPARAVWRGAERAPGPGAHLLPAAAAPAVAVLGGGRGGGEGGGPGRRGAGRAVVTQDLALPALLPHGGGRAAAHAAGGLQPQRHPAAGGGARGPRLRDAGSWAPTPAAAPAPSRRRRMWLRRAERGGRPCPLLAAGRPPPEGPPGSAPRGSAGARHRGAAAARPGPAWAGWRGGPRLAGGVRGQSRARWVRVLAASGLFLSEMADGTCWFSVSKDSWSLSQAGRIYCLS